MARDWFVIAVLIFITPIFLVLGGFIYKMSKGSFPEWLKSFVESFGITLTVYFGKDFEFVTFEGTLATLMGLLAGFMISTVA